MKLRMNDNGTETMTEEKCIGHDIVDDQEHSGENDDEMSEEWRKNERMFLKKSMQDANGGCWSPIFALL
jgi:hypothetical protein